MNIRKTMIQQIITGPLGNIDAKCLPTSLPCYLQEFTGGTAYIENLSGLKVR